MLNRIVLAAGWAMWILVSALITDMFRKVVIAAYRKFRPVPSI